MRKRQLEVALAVAEARLESLAPLAEKAEADAQSMKRRIAELEGIRRRAEEALDEKMAVTAQALEQVQELKIANAVLKERLDLVANYLPGAPAGPGSQTPGHMSEEEEDLRHAFAAGHIDKRMLGDALEAAGLANTEIALDFSPSDYPRLSEG